MMNNTNINFSGNKKVSNNNQRERNRRYKRLQRDKKRKEFLQLKSRTLLRAQYLCQYRMWLKLGKLHLMAYGKLAKICIPRLIWSMTLITALWRIKSRCLFLESGAEYLMLLMFICLNSLFLIKIGIWLNLKTRFYINIKRMNIICRETVITILSQAKL